MQLDHINIKASKLLITQEKDFLCEVLGLNIGKTSATNSQGYWLYNDNNQAIIHLSVDEMREESQKESQGYFDHFALQSKGLSEFVKRLKRKNIEYQTRYLPDLDITQVFIFSTLNIRIELSFNGEKL